MLKNGSGFNGIEKSYNPDDYGQYIYIVSFLNGYHVMFPQPSLKRLSPKPSVSHI